MNLADKIHQHAQRLPEPLAREVLDFIGYLEQKHGVEPLVSRQEGHLKAAQMKSMQKLWDNPEDEIWNDV